MNRLYLIVALVLLLNAYVSCQPYYHGLNGVQVDSDVLTEYINRPDPNYAFYEMEGAGWKGDGYTVRIINMTSQQWLTEADVSQTIWWHYVAVIIPDKINPLYADKAFIYATQGANSKGDQPKPTTLDLFEVAPVTLPLSVLSVILWQIPNQPLVFTADPTHKRRKEDSLLAFAWYMFLNNPTRTDWLPRLPMVKAVVKCMDTIQTFSESQLSMKINSFVVGGASKRGWTAWLVGAIEDPRVIGIIPIVMNVLNFEKNVMHTYQSLGGWFVITSFAFEPYWELNLTRHFGEPVLQTMMNIVDPIMYSDRLSQVPKIVVSSSGDFIFLLDDDHWWYDNNPLMQKNTYLHLNANCEHTCATCLLALQGAMRGWLAGLLYQDPAPPQFTWKITNGTGDIILTSTQGIINKVQMWTAHTISTVRRDFRLFTWNATTSQPQLQPVFWSPTVLEPQSDGTYIASQPMPSKGWTGFYMQINYASFQGEEYAFTTTVSIIPQVLPFPACAGGDACFGSLV